MRIQIEAIKINPGRRELSFEHVEELANSIAELGLLNPITVDQEYTLIAGLHRLEAVKKLGWTEIEATVSSLAGLQAELAEIDENFVRHNLSTVEYGDLLLRRKEIYEAIHPETKSGLSQAAGMNRAMGHNVTDKMAATSRPFVEDTAEKLGVAPRTVRRQIQAAKNLTTSARDILRHSDISKKDALKISQLTPEQQEEAANMLVSGQIKSIDEYNPRAASDTPESTSEIPQGKDSPMKGNHHGTKGTPAQQREASKRDEPGGITSMSASAPSIGEQSTSENAGAPSAPPYSLGRKRYATIKESVADLKDPNKDCSCTPDSFLAEIDAFVQKFKQEIEWFHIPYYDPALPGLTQVQLDFFLRQMELICDAARNLTTHVKKGWSNREQEA